MITRRPETRKTARAATLTVLDNPNSDERIVPVNMEQNIPKFNLPVSSMVAAEPLTMSSREIAELCEKQHKHVMRDIKVMLEQIGVSDEGYAQIWTNPQNGQEYPEYRLPKDLTVTLITGYRADLRYKVVKRLEELEGQGAPVVLTGPQLMAAALIEADATMRAQAAQIETMRGDVAAYDRLAKADGSLCITDAAKALQMRPKDLFDWLRKNGWIYKRPGSAHDLGYQAKTTAGLLEHKVTTVLRADGSEKVTEQVRVTPQGLAKLAKLIAPAAKLIGGEA